MSTQSEAKLEADLIQQLIDKNYDSVRINDETELKANLKTQLEALNSLSLTGKEFSRALNHLNKGNVYERAGILRDKMQLNRDDGESSYLDFIDQNDWSKNSFQVTKGSALYREQKGILKFVGGRKEYRRYIQAQIKRNKGKYRRKIPKC